MKTCVVSSAGLDGCTDPAKHHERRGRVSGGERGMPGRSGWKEARLFSASPETSGFKRLKII